MLADDLGIGGVSQKSRERVIKTTDMIKMEDEMMIGGGGWLL